MTDRSTLQALAELVARELDAPPIDRRLVTRAEAAESLAVSLDTFERYVQPQLRVVRRGRLVLVPVLELDRWIDANAERTLPE